MFLFHVAVIRLRAAIQMFGPHFAHQRSHHSFTSQSILRQVHSLSQSEFFTESLYPVFCLFCNKLLYKSDPTQDVTNPVSLSSFYCIQDIPFPLDSVYFIPHAIRPTDLLHPSPVLQVLPVQSKSYCPYSRTVTAQSVLQALPIESYRYGPK